MITAQLHLCGIGISKTVAEFDASLSCTNIRLLIGSIAFWNKPATANIRTAIYHVFRDREWVIENAPSVRRAARLGYAKGKAEGKAIQHDYKQAYINVQDQITKLRNQKFELEYSVKALSRLVVHDQNLAETYLAQRDEMLEALEFVHGQMQSGAWIGSQADKTVSEAIAKVKGSKK